ncbi:MAG TPA: amino acid adenylation domain-containing protein [Candidatus Scybalocola faecavium]|nr:amino acid adenylation domain-containing protein [Candidatus Scybalocola faecavium]
MHKELIREEEGFPLSASQKNIWNLEKAYKGTPMNNICETFHIRGTFNVACLQECLNLVAESDPALRTRIITDAQGEPWQYEVPWQRIQFPVLDFSATNQEGILHWEKSVAREVMPLTDSPLFQFVIVKIGEHEGEVLIKTHHLISDGWSLVALINKIAVAYLELLEGKTPQIEPSPSYRLHVEDEEKYLHSKIHDRDVDYWKRILKDVTPPVSLKEEQGADVSPVGYRRTFYLTEIMNHELNAFCTSHRIAPFAVFYMAVAIYLKRTRGIRSFCMGAPVHNRSSYTDRKTTGMFVSTLPFFSSIDESWSFEEFAGHLEEDWLELLRHQKLSYGEIFAICKSENPSVHRLYHLVLSFHNSQAYKNHNTSVEFSGQWHYSGYQAEHICIHLNNIEDEKRYSVNYDYLAQLFSQQEIEHFHMYLMNILNEAFAQPKKPIAHLSFLGAEEKEKVLFGFNRTERYLPPLSLGQKMEEVCFSVPERVAVIEKGRRFTYKTLWDYGCTVADAIRHYCPGRESVVLLAMPRSVLLIAAMAGCAFAGMPWVILPENCPPGRMAEIYQDCTPGVILTSPAWTQMLDRFKKDTPCINMAELLNASEVSRKKESHAVICRDKNALAYLIYTSGSTGRPKGVMIRQESFLNFAMAMSPCYASGAVLSICNTGFDAFLIESIGALLNGRTVVLAGSDDVEDPRALAGLIRDYAVGFLTTTPSRLQAYMKDESFCKALSRIESIVCGGENFPGSLLAQLASYTGARVYNQYGPSETTVGVAIGLLNRTARITVGSPMDNCRCYILDKYKNPMPIGVYGELYVAGLCVGEGYYHDPEKTKAAFTDSPFEPGERMYCTGDIGCWTQNGEIVIRGREDSQVKLRGQRVELGEISAKLMTYPKIQLAAVRLAGEGLSKVPVAYYTADKPVPEQELMAFASSVLPDYMIPGAYIHVPSIPLNANGKLDASRLPLPELYAQEQEADPSSLAGKILEVFRKVLNRPDMPVSGDYFLYGGDSLNGLQVLTELENILGRRLRISDLYSCRNAAGLARHLGESPKAWSVSGNNEGVLGLMKAPKRDLYPLTPQQMGVYFETMMHPDSCSYNMPCAFKVRGEIRQEKLEQAFFALVQSEPVLRMGFEPGENGIGQKLWARVEAYVEDFSHLPLDEAKKAFVRPFDLTRPPLMRVGLWTEGQESIIFIDMHHIISDGESAAMLISRLNDFYEGKAREAGHLSYIDYAWTLSRLNAQLSREDQDFWRDLLKDMPEPVRIPTDFPRSQTFDYQGRTVFYKMTEADSRLCDRFCQDHGFTPFMLFTAAFGILLASVSRQDDVCAGTPVSVRGSRELKDMAGMFVNTLPIRIRAGAELTCLEYMEQIKKTVTGILDHNRADLESLAKMAGRKGNDMYHAILSMRPVNLEGTTFDHMEVQSEELPSSSAKMDLNLEVYKEKGRWNFRLEYADTLFLPQTGEFYARCIGAIAAGLARDEKRTLGNIPKISGADRFRLDSLTENLSAAFADVPVDAMVDMAAELAPDQAALIFRDETFTLGELKADWDALASRLQDMGLKQGDHIGILCRRGPRLLTAMMAVLKIGCAYVPMLPTFPKKRLESMMDQSGVKVTLCDRKTLEELPEGMDGAFVDIEKAVEEGDFRQPEPAAGRSGEDVCFILFTSGSTGQPKGVMIRHHSIANLYAVMKGKLPGGHTGFLCTANVIFDIFITETLLTLAMGNYIVMADEDEMVLPWKCARLIREHHVGIVEFTPSRAVLFMENPDFVKALSHIDTVLMCGEVFPPALLDKLRAAGCHTIYNLYGPTEVTVYCTMDDVTHTDKITVGQIFPNCWIYVLDEHMKRVMPTGIGELYFGGACVSAGYVGRPDLTKELFVKDPFRPGEIIYRSGDLVRLLPDGRIDFAGRGDHQIKLNGQRVELAEIQGKIISSGLIGQAAVVAVSEGDFKALRAFVTPKPGETVDTGALRQWLESELPGYMVPSSIQVLDHLPVTDTGKTDLKALEKIRETSIPAPVPAKPVHLPLEEADRKNPDPQAVDGRTLEGFWKDALKLDEIQGDQSFFEQGGTSLTALNLLSRYYNHGLSMTLSQFYGNPTLNQQKAFFFKDKAGTEMSPAPVKAVKDPRCVFLTGATGFFGAHVLQELIQRGYKKIYCLVRGSDPRRFEDTMEWYFGRGFLARAKKRIEVLQGDIVCPRLGLSPEQWSTVTENVGVVIHAAADVRHYADSDEPVMTNREGTRHVLELAEAAGGKMVYISTVSLGSEFVRNQPELVREFSEDDFNIGQNWEDNIYLKGKFQGETLVRKAAEDGMDVKILRIGRLVGRSSDGVFQKNPESNAFWGLVSGILKAGMIPDILAHLPLDTTAVDDCAAAAVTLMEKGERMVYHVFNPKMKTVSEIAAGMGLELKLVSRDVFEAHLRQLAGNTNDLSISMLLTQYDRFTQVPMRISPVCRRTEEALSRLGFTWEMPDVERILAAFVP